MGERAEPLTEFPADFFSPTAQRWIGRLKACVPPGAHQITLDDGTVEWRTRDGHVIDNGHIGSTCRDEHEPPRSNHD